MNRFHVSVITLSMLLAAGNSYGFGARKMQVSELKGVTESQVAKNEGKASVMVRGKAAELVFRMMKQQQEEQTDTDALKWVGTKNGAHWLVKGKQVSCSKVSNQKTKQDDFACAFEFDDQGNVAAGGEAFSPAVFNLAKTETGSKLFSKKKAKGRGLASVATDTTYSKGQAYLVYDEPGKARQSENALIVFRGDSAREILGLLENGKGNREAKWGEGKGWKGNEIACVGATGHEPERCAMVVSFKDGSVTKRGNPLFR